MLRLLTSRLCIYSLLFFFCSFFFHVAGNLTFQTQKTLELHIQKHHSSSAFVFQCPACSLTFLQPAAVIRHLSKDHKCVCSMHIPNCG